MGGADLDRVAPSSRASLPLALVRAGVATGRLDEADGWADLAVADAGRLRLPAGALRGARARAEVLLARDDPAAAAGVALEATGAAETAGLAQEELEARLLAGRALLGAPRDGAARELRRAGARVSASSRRAAAPGGPDTLTPREREIAQLVAQGRSNKEVAGPALFLGEDRRAPPVAHLRQASGRCAATAARSGR